MGHPQPLTAPHGDSYRLEKGSAFFVWAFLIFASAVSFLSPHAAFLLIPFSLVFVKLNPYRFLVLWIAATVFFFETYRSDYYFLTLSDGLLLVYAFLLTLFALPKGLRLRLPLDAPFIPLYLLAALALAHAPGALLKYPPVYALLDVRFILVMLFIPVLILLDGSGRAAKKVFLLLGSMVLFSSLHALEVILTFLRTGGRPYTWTGIFLVSSVPVALVMQGLPFSRTTRWMLRATMVLCALGVIVTQTRGLWLSMAACLGYYFLVKLLRMRGKLRYLFRFALIAAAGFVAVNLGFIALSGKSLMEFILWRLSDLEWIGLIDPYSSLGYRIHESWMVWEERTFWGHGPGATINLFFTQGDKSQFMDWWSIHSGYFEILHKYGFVGVFLLAWMGVALFLAAGRLGRRRHRWEAAGGLAVQLMLLNHAIASITSNEFNRFNSGIMWLLAFYTLMKLKPPAKTFAPRPPA